MFKSIILSITLLLTTTAFAETIPFNWQHKRAIVTETTTRSGLTIQYRYPIELKTHEKGWLVDYGEIEPLAMGDEKLSDAQKLMTLAILGKVATNPDIIVDKQGNPLEISDWQGYLNSIAAINPSLKQSIEIMNKDKNWQDVVYKQSLHDPWCTWVCSFIGVDLNDTSIHRGEPEQAKAAHFAIDYHRDTHYRLVSKRGDWWQVEVRSHISLDDFSSIDANKPLSRKDKSIIDNTKLSSDSVVIAEIHAKTGEPKRVEFTKTVNEGGTPKEYEYTVYEFDWQ